MVLDHLENRTMNEENVIVSYQMAYKGSPVPSFVEAVWFTAMQLKPN